MLKGKEISLLTFSNFDPFDVPRSYFFVLNQENRKHHNWLQALEIAKFVNVTRILGKIQNTPPSSASKVCRHFVFKFTNRSRARFTIPCHRLHVRRRTVARERPIFVPGSHFSKQVQTRQTKVRTG